MSHIDTIIARIPSMNANSHANLRNNIGNTLKKTPDDSDASRVLDALDAFEDANDKPQRLEVTGLLAWEKRPREKQYTFRAFHEELVVGRIYKRADHSSTEKDVYSVKICGEHLPEQFHHIKDARAAGEAAYIEQNAESRSE